MFLISLISPGCVLIVLILQIPSERAIGCCHAGLYWKGWKLSEPSKIKDSPLLFLAFEREKHCESEERNRKLGREQHLIEINRKLERQNQIFREG